MARRGNCYVPPCLQQTAYTSEYPSYLCGHMKEPLAKCCFTIAGSRRLNQTFRAVNGVQSKRLKKIQMGCRCCKMIRSYIFDSEEVQSPGCIHEVNSYKYNEQGSNTSKFKENNETQEHKNELQKDELNRAENTNRVNNTKETLWNKEGNDFQEDGLVKCAAKPDVAVNGGNSCAGARPVLSPSANAVPDAGEQGTSSQPEASSASNRDLHTKPNRPGPELDLAAGRQRKEASNEPNSIQDKNSGSAEGSTFLNGSTTLETQNNAIQLPDTDYPQNGNQTRNYVKKESSSVNCAHSGQNHGPSAIPGQDLRVTPPLPVENSIQSFKTASTSPSEDMTGGDAAVAVTKAAQAPPHPNHGDTNGETEEEDAEVAAALAALAAATAGEDVEDDDEY